MAATISVYLPSGGEQTQLMQAVAQFNRDAWPTLLACKEMYLVWQEAKAQYPQLVGMMAASDPDAIKLIEQFTALTRAFAAILRQLGEGNAEIFGYKEDDSAPLMLAAATKPQIERINALLRPTMKEIGGLGQWAQILKVAFKARNIIVKGTKVAIAAYLAWIGIEETRKQLDEWNQRSKTEANRLVVEQLQKYSQLDPAAAQRAKSMWESVKGRAAATDDKSFLEKLFGFSGASVGAVGWGAAIGMLFALWLLSSRRRD